jgi:hypothetical protein
MCWIPSVQELLNTFTLEPRLLICPIFLLLEPSTLLTEFLQ